MLAFNILAQLAVGLKCCLVGGKIWRCLLDSKPGNQFVMGQSMLADNLGSGVFRNAAAYGFCLHQNIKHIGTVQLIETQNARHTAADDQYIRVPIPVQCRKVWLLPGLLP